MNSGAPLKDPDYTHILGTDGKLWTIIPFIYIRYDITYHQNLREVFGIPRRNIQCYVLKESL